MQTQIQVQIRYKARVAVGGMLAWHGMVGMVGCGGMAGQTARMPVGRGRGAPTFSPPFFSIFGFSKYAFVIKENCYPAFGW